MEHTTTHASFGRIMGHSIYGRITLAVAIFGFMLGVFSHSLPGQMPQEDIQSFTFENTSAAYGN